MNLVRSFVVVTLALFFGLPLAGQTPKDDVAKLQARIKELEAENAKLKHALAKAKLGSLGVLHGQIVVIEGAYDPSTPIKSIFDFHVTSVNAKKIPGDVRLYTKQHEWAQPKLPGGKAGQPLKLKGFQCTQSVGDPFGRTALPFQLVEVFMIIEVIDTK